MNQNQYQTDLNMIRVMYRSAMDMQKLRIQTGNRITIAFKTKIGFNPNGGKEDDMEAMAKKVLDHLRASYNRITDGVASIPSEKKFVGDSIISEYSELLLVDNYFKTLAVEESHFTDIGKLLNHIPVYTEYLSTIKGIGPAMAGVIVSEIDITKAKYASSLHRLAGLDVVNFGKWTDSKGKVNFVSEYELQAFQEENPEGILKKTDPYTGESIEVELCQEGRSRRSYALTKVEYKDRDGNIKIKDSITFKPNLKTKLIGVLAPSFLRTGGCTVNGERMGAMKRFQFAKDKGFAIKIEDASERDDAVVNYLRAQGHTVEFEYSQYGKVYYDYKNRLANHPKHASKSPAHRHSMALRYMIKIFLNDLYANWRRIEGLEVYPPYHEAKLGLYHGQDPSVSN